MPTPTGSRGLISRHTSSLVFAASPTDIFRHHFCNNPCKAPQHYANDFHQCPPTKNTSTLHQCFPPTPHSSQSISSPQKYFPVFKTSPHLKGTHPSPKHFLVSKTPPLWITVSDDRQKQLSTGGKDLNDLPRNAPDSILNNDRSNAES
jgi:hypothetical protein